MTNGSSDDVESGYRDKGLATIAIQAIILVVALVGNSFVIVVLLTRTRRPLSRVYFLMSHLSLADLLVAVFNMLPKLVWYVAYRFRGPDVLCRVVKYLQVLVLYLSTYILVSMVLDRYLTLRNAGITSGHHHIRVSGLRRAVRAMVATSWIASSLLALPQAFVFRMRVDGPLSVEDCWAEFVEPWGVRAYVCWFVLTIFALPVLIIAIFSGLIYCRSVTVSRSSVTDMRGGSVRVAKTLRMTSCVVVCFFVCWSPFFFTHLTVAFSNYPPVLESASEFGVVGASHIQTLLLLLASLNSCLNPWIFLAFSTTLRKHLSFCVTTRAFDNDVVSVGGEDQLNS